MKTTRDHGDATLSAETTDCISRVREILANARAATIRAINAAMVAAYWEIGREIVEEEQRGESRAEYGARLIEQLSEKLTEEFGRGYSVANLRLIRQFYVTYAARRPAIRYTASSGLLVPTSGRKSPAEKRDTPCSESMPPSPDPLSPDLSWSHYRILMRVVREDARGFYEAECLRAGWSVRELQRQIDSLLFERLARSRDKEGVMRLAREGHSVERPADLIKDPYVLEFVGLPEDSIWRESDLEAALIGRLRDFLLELGRDLFFVARQRRITIDGDHFYVDLVFYHRVLRCFLLVDLKVGRLTQQDIGQMLLYTGYFEAEEMREDENPPVGLILCTSKNEAMVQYTLGRTANQVFAARYHLHLPSEEELARELERERVLLESEAGREEEDTGPPPS